MFESPPHHANHVAVGTPPRAEPTAEWAERCDALRAQLNELRRTRFFVPETIQKVEKLVPKPPKTKPPPRPKRAWTLQKSIWAPRKKNSDGKDFYDSGECLIQAFRKDWEACRSNGSLDKFIGKHSVPGGKPSPEQVETAVQEVENVLLTRVKLIYAT